MRLSTPAYCCKIPAVNTYFGFFKAVAAPFWKSWLFCGVSVLVFASSATAEVIIPAVKSVERLFLPPAAGTDGGPEIKELEQAHEVFRRQQFDQCLAQLILAREQHPNLPPHGSC